MTDARRQEKRKKSMMQSDSPIVTMQGNDAAATRTVIALNAAPVASMTMRAGGYVFRARAVEMNA